MNILSSENIKTNQQPTEFVLGDNGSAFVSMRLVIFGENGFTEKIVYEDQYTGSLTKIVPLKPGNYECSFIVQAYKQGALGPVYDSYLNISGSVAAFAKGEIMANENDDFGSCRFTLTIA